MKKPMFILLVILTIGSTAAAMITFMTSRCPVEKCSTNKKQIDTNDSVYTSSGKTKNYKNEW